MACIPAKVRPVQPFADAAPDRFLVQLAKITVYAAADEQSLVIFKARGVYSPEMERILSGHTNH